MLTTDEFRSPFWASCVSTQPQILLFEIYSFIQNDCRGFNNLSYILWSERENQQDVTVRCLSSTLSQHVSCIIMPIFRRTRRTVTFTVLAPYNAAPHNRYQQHPAEPEQHTTCSNTRLFLLKMGIMMPETCWESIDNKHLTVASCWFSLSLHNLFTTHGHRNLKLVIHNKLEIAVYVFVYLIEQHSKFLLHTLQVLYMCTLCDSTNISTIIEFVATCL